MRYINQFVITVVLLCAGALPLLGAADALAQEGSATGRQLDEIVVTARKRDESLQDIPIAVSVVTADEIDRAGFKGLDELSMQVAGLQYHDQGGQRPGRLNSAIRFRGMNVNSLIPTFQLGSLFVDGVFVLGSTHSIPLDDVERVEVIKGPQAAYFGRNTFGGAVNYITRQPSLETFGGQIQASAATFEEFDVSGSIEGPLIENKLGFRLGARFYNAGGMFTASDGGRLGQESTNSVNAAMFARPTDRLSIRFRAFYSEDDDGAPAGGFVGGLENNSCNGQTFTSPTGESVVPVNYFCNGVVPELGEALNGSGTNIIDSVTTLRPGIEDQLGASGFLINNLLNAPFSEEFGSLPSLDRIGLVREIQRYTLNVEYEFENGINMVVQGGYNDLRALWIRDQSFTEEAISFTRDPQSQQDSSMEVRVVSAQEQRLRWLGGVNYYEQEFIASDTGGRPLFYCLDTLPGNTAIGAGCLNSAPLAFNNRISGRDEVITVGFFAGLSYDITDQITLDIEGRYQRDRLDKAGQDIDADTFLPRVILQYQPSDNTNLYVSFAQGVLPGEANALFLGADDQERAQYVDQFGGTISGILPEEEISSYEIGWKQSFLDSRLTFSSAIYYAEWDNQKSRVIATIQETCDVIDSSIPGCGVEDNAVIGEPATLADGSPVILPRNATINGTGNIYGLEFESSVLLTDRWTANFTAALAESEFTSFESRFISTFANFSNVKGNKHARYPRLTASATTTYTRPVSGDWSWFTRGDWVYFGKTYVSVANIAECNDYSLLHVRTGIERDKMRLEAFVKNAFDNDSWSACARNSDFSNPIDFANFSYYQGASVTPQDRRQFGMKVSYRF